MSLFFEDLKREAAKAKPRSAPKGAHVPVESMNRIGCAACPRNAADLGLPKSEAQGYRAPLVYLLGLAPTHEEDEARRIWSGIAAREIEAKLRQVGADQRELRYHNIVNCAGPDPAENVVGVREVECCRGRVVADIEQSRPIVVVGVGDEPLHWATGLPRNANLFRGTMIATRIGRHDCWYFPILYPNYTKGKRRGPSEFETTLRHDIEYVLAQVERGLEPPITHRAPYDGGIECITGAGAGDMARLEEELHRMLALPAVAVDYETSCIKPRDERDPKLWTAAVGTFDRVVAFPVDHRDGWGTETRMRRAKGLLGEFLHQSGRKRCHNVAFEMDWSAYMYGERVLRRTEWEDTQCMAYAFDGRKGTKSLDNQCRVHFGFFLKDQSPVDVSQPGWVERHSLRSVLRYNALDSKWCDLLATRQLEALAEQPEILRVYENLMRTAPTLVKMTARGLPADFGYAEKMVADTAPRLAKLEADIRRTPEVRAFTSRFGTFSPTNADHVLQLMRDVLKRPEVAITDRDGGVKYSSKEEALELIPAGEVPSAPLILEHRGLTRNESTYLLPLLEGKLTAADGLIHAEYNQTDTVTSRLASPMHNWPKRKYKEVRGCVAPAEGEWFVAADQGQIEFRVAGMLSEDDNLVKYCWTGYDVHAYWAQRMVDEYGPVKDWIVQAFGVDWDAKGLKTLRQEAKNGWVFPQLFGSSTSSCAQRLHLPEDVADALGAEFWDEFRGVKKWQERTMRFYEKNLYVETLGGFRRRGPTTVNELINMPIQGTAYEIVREGMNALSELADAEDDDELHPAFNGHDDLSFIVSDAKLEGHIRTIAREMAMPRFDYVIVPLIVEVSVGPRWHQVEEVGKFSGADLFGLRNPYA